MPSRGHAKSDAQLVRMAREKESNKYVLSASLGKNDYDDNDTKATEPVTKAIEIRQLYTKHAFKYTFKYTLFFGKSKSEEKLYLIPTNEQL